MALSMIAKIAIAAAAGLTLLGLAGGGGGGGGTQQAGLDPQRTPSVPPAPPPSDEGAERNNDEGRTWGTFYVNRDAAKHYEMKVFSVASSPSNDAIGTGEVTVDVYETIVANADWQWQGQSCERHQWILTFEAGRLMSSRLWAVGGGCQSVRDPFEVWGRKIHWIQIGSNVMLVLDTSSGLNRRSPDKMIKARQNFGNKIDEYKPGKAKGTGKFTEGYGNFEEDTYPQWDNDNVSSGYVTLDASWIFTPA
jgi:hypothetical protein